MFIIVYMETTDAMAIKKNFQKSKNRYLSIVLKKTISVNSFRKKIHDKEQMSEG